MLIIKIEHEYETKEQAKYLGGGTWNYDGEELSIFKLIPMLARQLEQLEDEADKELSK